MAMDSGEQLGAATSSAAAAKGSETLSWESPSPPATALLLHYCNFPPSLLILKPKRWEGLTGQASLQADTCSPLLQFSLITEEQRELTLCE